MCFLSLLSFNKLNSLECQRKIWEEKYVTMKEHINSNVKQWDPLLRNFKIPLVFNWIMNCEVRETNNNNFPKIILFGSLLGIREVHSPLDVGNHCWLSVLIWKNSYSSLRKNFLTKILIFIALFILVIWKITLMVKKNLLRLRLSAFPHSLFQKLRKIFFNRTLFYL